MGLKGRTGTAQSQRRYKRKRTAVAATAMAMQMMKALVSLPACCLTTQRAYIYLSMPVLSSWLARKCFRFKPLRARIQEGAGTRRMKRST